MGILFGADLSRSLSQHLGVGVELGVGVVGVT